MDTFKSGTNRKCTFKILECWLHYLIIVSHTKLNFYRHEWSNERRCHPYQDAKCHDHLSRVSIAEVAEQRGEEHVADHERGLQGASLAVVDVVFFLDLSQDAWKKCHLYIKQIIFKISWDDLFIMPLIST